jgi:hypothetical protein
MPDRLAPEWRRQKLADVDLTGEPSQSQWYRAPTHGFSKPTRSRILLVDGYGVEGDAHACRCVRHRCLARKKS